MESLFEVMDAEILTTPISQAYRGLILRRGGEELGLKKVEDCFTVYLTSEKAHLPSSIVAFSHRQISWQDPLQKGFLLEEIRVDPQNLEEAMLLARASEEIAFVSHVYQLKDNAQALCYLTNQITVQFNPHTQPESIENIINKFALELIKPIEGINQTFVYQLTTQSKENPLKIANYLISYEDVMVAEANVILGKQSFSIQHSHHENKEKLAIATDMGVESLWELTKGDPKVIIAIAEDNINKDHSNFQEKDTVIVIREIAPKCALMPINITEFLDDQSIENLCDYALKKEASVLLCGWSFAAIRFPLSLRQSMALHRLATQGRKGKGCVIIFPAGNANRPVNGTIYERGWQNDLLKGRIQWLNGFASHPDVITVSACSSLNKKATYSNWGEEISVCAPSNNTKPMISLENNEVIFTAPEITTPLKGKKVFTGKKFNSLDYSGGNESGNFGGTSSPSAIVAGVVGLMLSANGDLTAVEVKEILQETADKIIDPAPDLQLGMKLGNYNHNSHSLWFGYGKVNGLKAVKLGKKRIKQDLTFKIVSHSNYTEIIIPDDEPIGVLSEISIKETGIIKDIEIKVNIDHEFLGDLEISIKSPQEQIVLLQNRILGAKTSLNKLYNLSNTPALQQLIKQSIEGDWFLWIVDYAKEDLGVLKGWEIIFKI
jgi:subtilisin-like proprotein convertase family protein